MRATDIVVTTREAGLDDQVRRHRLRQHPAGEVRRAAGPVLRRRHDLRRHRRRHGSGHPHGLRALHRRDPGRHRGQRHPRPQGDQGRPDHDGRQGAARRRRPRPGQRPPAPGDGAQGPQAVPVHRDHGLSRRLHRRRRPALRRGQLDSARRGVPQGRGPRRCTTWTGPRRSAAATTTRTCRGSTGSSWAGRSARNRTSCSTRTTRPRRRAASCRRI